MNNFPDSAHMPAPAPTRWQRFWAFPVTRIVLYLLLTAAISLVLVIAVMVFLAAVFGVLHLVHFRSLSPQALVQNQTLMMPLVEGLAAASAVLAFWLMVNLADKRPWATAGYNRDALLPGLLAGFGLGAVMLSSGIAVFRLLGLYHVQAVTPSALILVPLILYLAVAVFEETFFRGYLFQTLEGRWGSGIALGVSSLLFGLSHLANPVPGATHWMRVAGPLQICLEAGLPMGAAYLLTRRWWLPIGMHWAWDYFEGPVYGCTDSGNHDPHTLLRAALTGPDFVAGGPFGPEAGIIFLFIGTLTGVLLLQAAIRRGQWQPMPSRAGHVSARTSWQPPMPG